MNWILVKSWEVFKAYSENIIRDSFVKKKDTPLSPPDLSTNTQEYVASIQVFSGDKSKDINVLAHRTIGPIEIQEIRVNDPMVLFLEKGIQK